MSFFGKLEAKSKRFNKRFIIPTKLGMHYLAINFTIFLMALTYRNNLILAVSFILIAYYISIMLKTHNLINNFEAYNLKFNNQIKDRFQIQLHGPNKELLQLSLLTSDQAWLACKRKQKINEQTVFNIPSITRGKYQVIKIKISTTGLHNLFKVWIYKKSTDLFYIYPDVLESPILFESLNNHSIDQSSLDFSHFQKYQEQMPARLIDWKTFARTGKLYTKVYQLENNSIVKVNINSVDGEMEEKISKMAYALDYAKKNKCRFSFQTNTLKLSPSKAEKKYRQCMEYLSAI